MHILRKFLFTFVCSILIGMGGCMDQKAHEMMTEKMRESAIEAGIDPDARDTVMLTPATLDDEEEGSVFMPKAYRCDGCSVVALKLIEGFKSAEKHVKKGQPLPLPDVIDVVERVCDDPYENYGLKNIQGVKKLSGKGLPSDKESGMITAGPKWGKRFQNICKELLEKYEEDNIYEAYLQKKDDLAEILCAMFCNKPDKLMEQIQHKDEL